MGNKLNVILCAAGHLPSGTCHSEFEVVYNTKIKPLITALDKFPKIQMVFHCSGVILSWIERWHPELFMLFEDLISRKQIEILGGGFYNPVLPLLNLSDRIGQIDMLSTYLRKQFGKKPQGCWLPAMAWEQNLVTTLTSCGINYTFLREQEFAAAGIERNEIGFYSPCITEDQGKLLTVFPVADTKNGDLFKGELPNVLGNILEKLTPDGEDQIIVFPVLDYLTSKNSPVDGSFETKCMDLFEILSGMTNKVKFICPLIIFKNLHFLKKNYFRGILPGSYSESHPRQFLANNPEADGIYAKMIYVRSLIYNQLRGDKTRKQTALVELWKAQDSGLLRLGSSASPGILNSVIRKAAYRSLLEAELITMETRKVTPSLSVFDFDLDGEGEYIFQDEKLNCCIKSTGAGVFELDYFPAVWNYLDTLSVRDKKQNGCNRRCSFVEWLAPPDTVLEETGQDGVKGGRFCGDEEYEVSETDRDHHRIRFRLPPKADFPWGDIEIEKTWQFKKNSIVLEYALKNTSKTSQSFLFCSSVDLSFYSESEDRLRIFSFREGEKESVTLNEGLVLKNVKALDFQDIKNETHINLELSRGFDARIFHINTALTGKKEYQSTCILSFLPVSLDEGKVWKVTFTLKIYS